MSAFPPPTTGPVGWYPDPEGGTGLRYFDGRAWRARVETFAIAEREPHQQMPLGAAVGAVVLLVASLIAGRLIIEPLTQFRWPVVVYVAIFSAVGYGPSLWWCWYASKRWGTGAVARDVGLRLRWSDLGWGPLIWIGAVVTQIAVGAVVLILGIPTGSNVEGV
jgi:hypothetical protein